MDERRAKEIFERAMDHIRQEHPEVLEWAENVNQDTFKWLKSKEFLDEYCWVIYASGFRVAVIEAKFPLLRKAFKDFDLTALARMRSLKAVLDVFNNERKAECFLAGSKAIADEGFAKFKRRLKDQGVCVLETLPGIGPITKFHLAKNIGLVDEAKPDIWLVRAAKECSASVDELVTFLSKRNQMSRHVVDVTLWQYGADKNLGLRSG